jgi:hypothetical protein
MTEGRRLEKQWIHSFSRQVRTMGSRDRTHPLRLYPWDRMEVNKVGALKMRESELHCRRLMVNGFKISKFLPEILNAVHV